MAMPITRVATLKLLDVTYKPFMAQSLFAGPPNSEYFSPPSNICQDKHALDYSGATSFKKKGSTFLYHSMESSSEDNSFSYAIWCLLKVATDLLFIFCVGTKQCNSVNQYWKGK